MGDKEPDLYQGNDWITYRWSVAQVFDTLDQIRELCGLAPSRFSDRRTHAGGAVAATTRDEPESHLEMLSLLLALSDDLAGEMTIVLADLFHLLQPSPALQWKGFEMRLHLHALRQQCMPDVQAQNDEAPVLTKNALDTILALSLRMRDLLKQIDQ